MSVTISHVKKQHIGIISGMLPYSSPSAVRRPLPGYFWSSERKGNQGGDLTPSLHPKLLKYLSTDACEVCSSTFTNLVFVSDLAWHGNDDKRFQTSTLLDSKFGFLVVTCGKYQLNEITPLS